MQSKLHQPFFLYHIDQFIADGFLCGVADVVHPRDPKHLILSFQGFGHALLFCHLSDEHFLHFECLIFDVCKMFDQLAAC